MDVADETLKFAEAQEKAVTIMKRCQTPDEVRAGFLQIIELMSEVPCQETLLRGLKVGAQGTMGDNQVLQVRQKILQEFPKQITFLRESVKELPEKSNKKWWEFWK